MLEEGYIGPTERLGEHRIFETQREAVAAGFRYFSDEEALLFKYQGAMRTIARRRSADWLLEQLAKEGAAKVSGIDERRLLSLAKAGLSRALTRQKVLQVVDRESDLLEGRLEQRLEKRIKMQSGKGTGRLETIEDIQKLIDEKTAKLRAGGKTLAEVKAHPDLMALYKRKFNFQPGRFVPTSLFERIVQSARDMPVYTDEVTSLTGSLTAQALKKELLRLRDVAKRATSETFKTREVLRQAELDGVNARILRYQDIITKMQDKTRLRFGQERLPAPGYRHIILQGPQAKELAADMARLHNMKRIDWLDYPAKLAAGARFFALGADASVFGIQLLLMSAYDPVKFARTMPVFAKAMFSSKFHARLLTENADVIRRHPSLLLSRGGLSEITEELGKGGLLRIHIPYIKGQFNFYGYALEPFQRGFEAALDYAGIEMARGLEATAKNAADFARIDDFVNSMRGVVSTAKIGVSPAQRQLETIFFLAPRYNRAIGALLVSAWKGDISGAEARTALIRFTMGYTAMIAIISKAKGDTPEEMLDHLTPIKDGRYNRNFGMFDVLDQKFGAGSKVVSVMNLIAKSAANPESLKELSWKNPGLRWARGNMSIPASLTTDYLNGRDFLGEPVADDGLLQAIGQGAESLVPIWLQSIDEEGSGAGKAAALGISMFGGRAYFRGKMGNYEERALRLEQDLPDAEYDHYYDKPKALLSYEDIEDNPPRRDYYRLNHPETKVLYTDAKDELERRNIVNKRLVAAEKYKAAYGQTLHEKAEIARKSGDMPWLRDEISKAGATLGANYVTLDQEYPEATAELAKREPATMQDAAEDEYFKIMSSSKYDLPEGFDFRTRQVDLDAAKAQWDAIDPRLWERTLGAVQERRKTYHPLVQDYLESRDGVLRQYWGLVDKIAPPDTDAGRLFSEYLKLKDDSLRAAFKRQHRSIYRMEALLDGARLRLRARNPDVDLALAKWYGYKPITRAGIQGLREFRQALKEMSE